MVRLIFALDVKPHLLRAFVIEKQDEGLCHLTNDLPPLFAEGHFAFETKPILVTPCSKNHAAKRWSCELLQRWQVLDEIDIRIFKDDTPGDPQRVNIH